MKQKYISVIKLYQKTIIRKLISSGAMITYSAITLYVYAPLVSVEELQQDKRKEIWIWQNSM